MNSRQVLLATACAVGLGAAPTASALVAALNGPAYAKAGDHVLFSVDFSDPASVDDVVLFHDIFVAFDDTVLSYIATDLTFTGIVSSPNQGNIVYQDVVAGGTDGDYQAPPNGWTYAGADYGDGSVRVFQSTDFAGPPYSGLFDGGSGWSGQSLGFTAFSIEFEVIAPGPLTTTLALIDDTSYLEFDPPSSGNYYDYKVGEDDASWYPPSVVTATLSVPVPAPLALLGLGLGLLGAVRRARPAV